MNDGYIAFFAYWFMLLLWFSGFFDNWLKKAGIPFWALGGILIAAAFAHWVKLDVAAGVELNAGGFLLPFLLAFAMWTKAEERYRLTLLTQAFFTGATLFLLREMFRLDPVLMVVDELYLLAVAAVVISFVAAKSFAHLFIVLAMGLSFQETLFQLGLREHLPAVELGEGYYCDLWWVTFAFAFAAYRLRRGVERVIRGLSTQGKRDVRKPKLPGLPPRSVPLFRRRLQDPAGDAGGD
ncbi:hypothetical protein BSNK01_00810 [Bacillaceae bacterium]